MMTHILMLVLGQIAPPVVPGDDMVGWLLGSLKWTVEQMQAHNYVPAAAMIVMVLVFLFNKFAKDKIKSSHLPLISAGVGVLATMATNLLALAVGSTTMDWLPAIFTGLTVGTAASGFWSLLGKYVVEKLGVDKK